MTPTQTSNPGITWLKPNPSASLRLFCFPYAGGNSYVFRSCLDRVPKTIEICPISVFGGLQDREVQLDELEAWREHTVGSFSLKMLTGDHFFIHSSQSLLPELIKQMAIRS
jgi:surfactin synthase thioesterase subunit